VILSQTTAKNMTNFEHCVLSILYTVCVIIIIISIIIIIIINQTRMVFRLLQTYVYLIGCSKIVLQCVIKHRRMGESGAGM